MNARCTTAANATMLTKGSSVIGTLACSRYANANSAVSTPPMKSTTPVPMMLRTPSTSLIIRDTSVPVRFSS